MGTEYNLPTLPSLDLTSPIWKAVLEWYWAADGENAGAKAHKVDAAIHAALRDYAIAAIEADRAARYPDDVEGASSDAIYRWRALDHSGFCYGSNPPDDLPQSADLTAFFRQTDAFKNALHEISATGNLTATPEQFARHLQKTARDALEAAETEALSAQHEAAKEHAAAALALLSRMRFACGDDGTRMQDELEQYLRKLRRDAERIDALQRMVTRVHSGDGYYVSTLKFKWGDSVRTRSLRHAIDAAIAAAKGE